MALRPADKSLCTELWVMLASWHVPLRKLALCIGLSQDQKCSKLPFLPRCTLRLLLGASLPRHSLSTTITATWFGAYSIICGSGGGGEARAKARDEPPSHPQHGTRETRVPSGRVDMRGI